MAALGVVRSLKGSALGARAKLQLARYACPHSDAA